MNNTNKRILQTTEDLIVAILLGNSIIETNEKESVIRFQIMNERVKVLENFIEFNQLSYLPLKNTAPGEYILQQDITLKRILTDLTQNNKVKYIDPALLNVNMFMLWFSLFGYKGDRKVYITSNIDEAAKKTLVEQLRANLELEISAVPKRFIIHSASRLAYLSILHKRPQYETSILIQMANEKERKKLSQLIDDREEGIIQDVKFDL